MPRPSVDVLPSAPATEDATPVGRAAARRSAPAAGRGRAVASARPATISRQEEYRYIRQDLRRLLLTAGGLLVVMLVLLAVLDV